MICTPAKTPQTYLSHYQTLLDKARLLNDSDLDTNKDPQEVFVKQEVPVMMSRKVLVTLQANLALESVRASYEVETPNNLPNSSLAFRREGQLLWVEESALPSLYKEGKQHQFSIDMQTQEVANETKSVLPKTQALVDQSKALLGELSAVGQLMQPMGWVVGTAWRT